MMIVVHLAQQQGVNFGDAPVDLVSCELVERIT
jgi:hypothetical protein